MSPAGYVIIAKLSTTDTRRTGMVAGQLPGIHQKGTAASRFTLPIPIDYYVGGLSQAPSKNQVNHRTLRSIAGDLGPLATGTNQHGSLRLKSCTKVDGEHFKQSK